MSEHDGSEDDVVLDLTVLVGMWADSTRVHRARTEFTVDFVRNVPLPLGRALVARAVLTPLVAVELRDQLDDAWRRYSEWSMPEETDDR